MTAQKGNSAGAGTAVNKLVMRLQKKKPTCMHCGNDSRKSKELRPSNFLY